jgi:hypothetical protein
MAIRDERVLSFRRGDSAHVRARLIRRGAPCGFICDMGGEARREAGRRLKRDLRAGDAG